MDQGVHIVFSANSTSPDLTFVEVENDDGQSISVGEWSDRDGYRVLTLPALAPQAPPQQVPVAHADPDRPCPHENFSAVVAVNRLTAAEDGPVAGFVADIRVECANCSEPFRWIGVPAGLSPREPMVSIDETELRAPLRPASSDPDFGLGLPGFAIRQVG